MGIVNFHDSFLQAYCVKPAARSERPYVSSESIGRIRFRPMYAWARGTRPEPWTVVEEENALQLTDLTSVISA